MKHTSVLLTTLLLALLAALHAGPNLDQERIAEAFAARSVGSKIITDDSGNVG